MSSHEKTDQVAQHLNAPQQEAAELFEHLARAMFGSPGGSSLDDRPEPPAPSPRDQWRWNSLRRALNPGQRSELINVLWAGQRPSDIRRLRGALNAVSGWIAGWEA